MPGYLTTHAMMLLGAGVTSTPTPTPTPTTTIPDPGETSWTLGVGGDVVAPSVAAGFALHLSGTLRNAGIAVAFSPSDSLDASVWFGQAGASLATPAVAWISAPGGTLSLAISAAQSAALAPGSYRLRVGVTTGGNRLLAYDGTLEVSASPGSATYRVPYCSADDLALYYDQLPRLMSLSDDTTGFLTVRANQSDALDREVVYHYSPRPGFVRVRQSVMDPVFGWDVPDPSAVAPSPRALDVALKAGGLVADRNVREVVARRSIAEVLERQEVSGGRNTYRDEAAAMRAAADAIVRAFEMRVDTNLDGVADLLVGIDAILLPAGTEP